jgi:hypothetical protein
MIKLKSILNWEITKKNDFFLSYLRLSKNRRRQVQVKLINKPKIIKNESVHGWWDDGWGRINFGNIGGRGGGIRR